MFGVGSLKLLFTLAWRMEHIYLIRAGFEMKDNEAMDGVCCDWNGR